jgi:hypothetical protein
MLGKKLWMSENTLRDFTHTHLPRTPSLIDYISMPRQRFGFVMNMQSLVRLAKDELSRIERGALYSILNVPQYEQ